MGNSNENPDFYNAQDFLAAAIGELNRTRERSQRAQELLGPPIGKEFYQLGFDTCHLIKRDVQIDLGDTPINIIRAYLYIGASIHVPSSEDIEEAFLLLVRDFTLYGSARFAASEKFESVYNQDSDLWLVTHPVTGFPIAIINRSSRGVGLAVPSVQSVNQTAELTTEDVIDELERYYETRLADGLPLIV